jgi:hypothetical protein
MEWRYKMDQGFLFSLPLQMFEWTYIGTYCLVFYITGCALIILYIACAHWLHDRNFCFLLADAIGSIYMERCPISFGNAFSTYLGFFLFTNTKMPIIDITKL